jgi:hypothetical protein
MERSSMTQPTQRDLTTQIREAQERIEREFQGKAPPDVVAKCVGEAEGAVSTARVPDYASIFFARRARRLITEAITEPIDLSELRANGPTAQPGA